MFKVVCTNFWPNDDGLNDSSWEILLDGQVVGTFGVVGYPGNHDWGGFFATKDEVEEKFSLFSISWI